MTAKTAVKAVQKATAKADQKPIVISYLRFSNATQSKGDSVKRQLEKSQQWADARGLTIAESLRDCGVSAFRGKNATTGALGGFLALVEAGKIPPGSTLIVESLDRLSRDTINQALQQFLAVINQGVRIVTLMDGFEYDKENTSLPNLMYSLMVMSRAHDESFTKSDRLKNAWNTKREKIGSGGTPYTRKLAFWLRFNGNKIDLDPDGVKLLRSIFKMAARDGLGPYAICRKLKDAGTPLAIQTVRYTLRSRQPLGEFQPCTLIYKDGRRFQEPVGKPITDYLPQAIDEAMWLAAQRAFKERRWTGGRKNAVKLNLFRGLLVDADLTPWHMMFRYKQHRYFRADPMGAGDRADYGSIPVTAVESGFLFAAQTFLDLSTRDEVGSNAERIAELEATVERLDAKIEAVQEAALKSDNIGSIVTLLRKLEAERARVVAELTELKEKQPVTTDHLGELQRLLPLALHDKLDNDDRGHMAGLIKRFVTAIMMSCWRTGGKRNPSYHAKLTVKLVNGKTSQFGVSTISPSATSDEDGFRFYEHVRDMPKRE